MRQILLLIAVTAVVIVIGAPQVEAVPAPLYGHGFQWLRDDDGDGIPNCLDDDYVPPLDGTGYKMMHQGMTSGLVLDVPIVLGDRIRDRDKDQDQDRDPAYDRIRLRLKDQSCQ